MSEATNDSDLTINDLCEFKSLSADSKIILFEKAIVYINTNNDEGEWWDKLCRCALESLDDEAAGVRKMAGQFMGDMSKKIKSKAYIVSRVHIITRMSCLIKQLDCNGIDPSPTTNDELNKESVPVMQSVLLHKHLDSWICCLERMAVGSGPEFSEYVDVELLNLILCCLDCGDMYLEQDCMRMVHSLVHDCMLCAHLHKSKLQDISDTANKVEERLVCILLKGMSSRNPGTRYQSCKAVKIVLLSIPDMTMEPADRRLALLPALWFNRYSKENGLQQLCQETWIEVTKGQGKVLIETHFQAGLNYCFKNLESKTVVDATNACHCLSELVRKVDQHLVGPEITKLFTMLKRFLIGNTSPNLWQLTDAICLLLGDVVSDYSIQMRQHVEELWKLMIPLVTHPSINVKDSSSMVLCRIVKFYEPRALRLDLLLDMIDASFQHFLSKGGGSSISEGSPSALLSNPLAVVVMEKMNLQHGQGTAIAIEPMESHHGSCTTSNLDSSMYSVYSHFCILLYLLPLFTQELPHKIVDLTNDLWSVLEFMERAELYDLAVLFLSRLPEFFDNMPREKRKQQLDLCLRTIIKMIKQSANLRSHDCFLSCLEKLGKSFGWSYIRIKLMAIDEEFAKDFVAKYS